MSNTNSLCSCHTSLPPNPPSKGGLEGILCSQLLEKWYNTFEEKSSTLNTASLPLGGASLTLTKTFSSHLQICRHQQKHQVRQC